MSIQVDSDASAAITGLRIANSDGTYGTAPAAVGVYNEYPLGLPIVHRVHKVKVAYTALTAAAVTQDITLWTTPARTRIVRVIAQDNANFTGGSISAMTVKVGVTAGGAQLLLAGSVFTGTALLGDVVAEMGAGVVSATLADYFAAAQTISVRFTATGDNVNAATAGDVDFYIETISYPVL